MKHLLIFLIIVCLGVLAHFSGTGSSHARSPSPCDPHSHPPRPREADPESLPYLSGHPSVPRPQAGAVPATIGTGTKIAFQSYRDGNWEIYLANGDGTGQTRLTNHTAIDSRPRLNRGCTRIAFASKRQLNYDIYTMSPSGSDVRQLTGDPSDDTNPAWSPDGTRLAFQSYRDSQSEIYLMNADGTALTRLTSNGVYDGEPIWSPDGTKIAFTSYRNSQYRIWTMNANGSNQTQFSFTPYSEYPAWSPDGTAIAFDADSNANGWQDLWIRALDGSWSKGYDALPPQVDGWVRSWSPDSQSVAFTSVAWVLVNNQWYWSEGYLDGWLPGSQSFFRWTDGGLDWHPDWQSCDLQAPSSQVNSLGPSVPANFAVTWSGSDAGAAGIRDYDVQMKRLPSGEWTGWQTSSTAISSTMSGLSGESFCFRSRARDWAGNVEAWPPGCDASATVETLPPITRISPLPRYTQSNHTGLSWRGYDPGDSGISTFDIQVRQDDGPWTDWTTRDYMGSDTYYGQFDHTFYFHSRAVDRAGNREPTAEGDGDATTTFYWWSATSRIRDNRDTHLAGATVTTSPPTPFEAPSTENGDYTTYLMDGFAPYLIAWSKAGHGSLPFVPVRDAPDRHFDVNLPPADDAIINGHFESPELEDWQPGGVATPVITSTLRHTGSSSVLLSGPQTYFTPLTALATGGGGAGGRLLRNPDGSLHIVFARWPGLYYVYGSPEGQWGAPEQIGTQENSSSAACSMALDSSVQLHVVCRTFAQIYHSVRSADGTWAPLQAVATASEPYYTAPTVATDITGTLHLAWDDGCRVKYSSRSIGGDWSPVTQLVYPACRFQMGVDAAGTVHLIWGVTNSLEIKVYYTQRAADGPWSEPVLIYDKVSPMGYQKAAVAPDGSVHVVWDTDRDIQYGRRSPDGTWHAPVNISNDQADSRQPQLILDAGGVPHVVWQQWYSRLESDGTWSPPYDMLHGLGEGSKAHFYSGGCGAVYVFLSQSWHDYSVKRQCDGTWTLPEPNYLPSGGGDVIVDPDGVIHNLTTDVYYSRSAVSPAGGDSKITQHVATLAEMANPTLSFVYKYRTASTCLGCRIQVEVWNPITAAIVLSTSTETPNWAHVWYDLSAFAGTDITVTASVREAEGQPVAWAYLDEITVGSSFGDLWVSASSADLAPGHSAPLLISYGNRGGAPAGSAWLTVTLPAALTLVSVSPPPATTTASLIWDLGAMEAGAVGAGIVVTVSLAPGAQVPSTYFPEVLISSALPEVELANNLVRPPVHAGYRGFLPLVGRGIFE